MQKRILYGRSTALPHIHNHFRRPRIDRLLAEAIEHPLIIVTAGTGWGKTHAVSSFLKNAPARVVWFQLSELDNYPTRFWEEFIYIMAFQNKETTDKLEQLGFPDTLAKFDQFLHILARVIYTGELFVFAFDDLHLIYDEMVLHFVRNLITANLENTCIIVISRTILNFTGLYNNNLIYWITAKDLQFTAEETGEYLNQNHISLTARELKRVQHFTEGWPLALFLVSLLIKKGGSVSNDSIAGAIPLIFKMIEREIFSQYSSQIQFFLIKISTLNSFPEGLVHALAGDELDTILDFLNTDMFTYYSFYTGHYHFHHLFFEFLKGKQRYLKQQEMTDTYLKAADWCRANNLMLEALSYYNKCSHYDDTLNTILNFGASTFPKSSADFYIGLIDEFPIEFVNKNPIIHVLRAGLLLNNAAILPAIEELVGIQKELEAMPPTKDNKIVLGNIYFMLGLISLGSCNYDFTDLFRKASDCLPEGGIIDNNGKVINTKYAIMLATPSPGELEKMEEALFYAIPYASKAMHGYGHGMDCLASAEAAYFTGDMKKAASNAYQAIYRASDKPVSDVVFSGYFLLMRINAANGNYKDVVSHLEQLRANAERLEDKKNFCGMLDVAEGWFHILLDSTEKVADWIVNNPNNVLAPYSTGMERLVKARCLLREERYYELLAWLGQSEELFWHNNMWLVLLDNYICKAIASHHIHDEKQTITALQKAYEVAHGNGLVMQFAEFGKDMRAVIYTARNSALTKVPDTWLNEISAKAATYEKHLNRMKAQYRQSIGNISKPQIKLTKVELEVIRYLCQGLTNTEIANTRYTSLSAVKKTLSNIYIKLNATNRADAVRIAIQMGLL